MKELKLTLTTDQDDEINLLNSRFNKAIRFAKDVLGTNVELNKPDEVSHSYNDKYLLAEHLANSFITCQLNCLLSIGFTQEHLKTMYDWAINEKQVVSVEFISNETCSFIKKHVYKQEANTKRVTSILSPRGIMDKISSTVVNKITEYHWKFSYDYTISIIKGSNKEKISIVNQKGKTTLITSSDYQPRPKTSVKELELLDLTLLFQTLTPELQSNFKINKQSPLCYTPRRNSEITNIVVHLQMKIKTWSESVRNYLKNDLFSLESTDKFDMEATQTNGIELPILSLFHDNDEDISNKNLTPDKNVNESPVDVSSPVLLQSNEMKAIFDAHLKSIQAKREKIQKLFESYTKNGLIIMPNVFLIIILEHMMENISDFIFYIGFIEDMIREQLIKALGKIIEPHDFSQYMNYHYRKIFLPKYQPKKFSYSITRIDHHPDGFISIESNSNSLNKQEFEPVLSIVNKIQLEKPMKFSIDAATKITIHGDCFIHSWINHQFSSLHDENKFQITARSGPYCNFILLLGNIHASDLFYPTHATIIKSKDLNILIPLFLEYIPSAKTFRDATESLSEEMKEFAKSYRNMQLESTLFGFCVIQIKPQLEKLLNLPYDSLTKEIELTEDIQDLFIKYQIPSDLISYDDDKNLPVSFQINRVKYLVNEMKSMVHEMKLDEIKDVEQKASVIPSVAPIIDSDSDDDDICVEPIRERPKKHMRKKRRGSFTKVLKRAFSKSEKMTYSDTASMDPFERAFAEVSNEKSAGKRSRRQSKKVAPKKTKSKQGKPKNEKPEQKSDDNNKSDDNDNGNDQIDDGNVDSDSVVFDISKIPHELDKKFEAFDSEGALRSAIIKVSDSWTKTHQASFLTDPKDISVSGDQLREEKNAAFDLLDALSRSGILDIDYADFHVIMTSTHSFDNSIMDTLVQKSINPIAKVERSALIVSSTIHDVPVTDMINPDYIETAKSFSPQLF